MPELFAVGACAAAKAVNKAVKEVTGKSIANHCKSAAKGLRNIVLQKAGEAMEHSADIMKTTVEGKIDQLKLVCEMQDISLDKINLNLPVTLKFQAAIEAQKEKDAEKSSSGCSSSSMSLDLSPV